jgi:hypothetical protein
VVVVTARVHQLVLVLLLVVTAIAANSGEAACAVSFDLADLLHLVVPGGSGTVRAGLVVCLAPLVDLLEELVALSSELADELEARRRWLRWWLRCEMETVDDGRLGRAAAGGEGREEAGENKELAVEVSRRWRSIALCWWRFSAVLTRLRGLGLGAPSQGGAPARAMGPVGLLGRGRVGESCVRAIVVDGVGGGGF